MCAVRHWAFTLNNFGDVDVAIISDLSVRADILVCVAARERGEGGTPHIQGHLGFQTPRRLPAVRILLPRAHWTQARSVDHSIEYCRKDGDMIIDIDKRTPGKRTDLSQLVEALESGGLPEAKRVCPEVLIRYPAGAKLLVSLQDCPARDDFRVMCFIGPAGCGKSLAARTYNPYTWTRGDWFDGYNGESTILLDDFLGSHSGLSLSLFLRLADRGALRLPCKGGFIVAKHSLLVITANSPPMCWYPEANVGAIERRTINDLGTLYMHPTPFPTAAVQNTHMPDSVPASGPAQSESHQAGSQDTPTPRTA